MKGIKPQKLSLLSRPFEHKKQVRLGVSILGFFSFDDPEQLLSEVAMWKFLAQALGKDAILDAGIPKSRAEFLVHGAAFAPESASRCMVRVQVGELEKKLAVFGDRFWTGDAPTEPVPFREMPLRWENAFGGSAFKSNPLGKGAAPIESGAGTVQPLPNIEDPTQLMTTPSDQPVPAGLGPIDITWPQRAQYVGTYDQDWLENLYPGFAEDIDWRLFNMASGDQQQESPFVGGEAFEIENMHPEKQRVVGRIPRLHTRAFITQKSPDGEVFREVAARLMTVWLFPAAERGVTVYQGSIDIREDDTADVLHLMIAAEDPDAPKPVEHYQAVLRQRLDPQHGHLYALRDSDLLPATCAAAGEENAELEAMLKREGILESNQRRRSELVVKQAREMVEKLGLDPDVYAPPMPAAGNEPPSLEELPDFVREMQETADTRRRAMEEKTKQLNEELKEACQTMGVEFVPIQDRDAPTGPPPFRADSELERLRQLADAAKREGMRLAEIEDKIADPAFHTELEAAEARVLDAYRASAHFQVSAPRRKGSWAERVRAAIIEEHASGASFAGRDLTGIDLGGLDLRRADFSGALLESVNFHKANLEGADLSRAVLAHATLVGAKVGGANLAGANLGRANAAQLEAQGAKLNGAILMNTDFSGADMRQAEFVGALFMETVLTGANLSSARLDEVQFMRATMAGAQLVGASLRKSVWMEVEASRVDFTLADLEGATFVGGSGKSALFRGAKMRNARLIKEAEFENADFSDACLDGANLRGANLRAVNFRLTSLHGADLSESDLSDARGSGMAARNAQLVRANCTDADLQYADLLGASLQKANLSGTNLGGANLYKADFAQVLSDRRTNVRGANQLKTRTRPTREV